MGNGPGGGKEGSSTMSDIRLSIDGLWVVTVYEFSRLKKYTYKI